MLTEILALLVSYSGVFAGRFLKDIAKEEVREGKRNIAFLQSLIFIITLMWFFYSISGSILYRTGLALLFIVIIYLLKNNYAILGIMFGLLPSFGFSTLVFLYGFPTGSLMSESHKEVFKKTGIYVVLAVITYAITLIF